MFVAHFPKRRMEMIDTPLALLYKVAPIKRPRHLSEPRNFMVISFGFMEFFVEGLSPATNN